MLTGWRYRLASLSGAAILTFIAVMLANQSIFQHLFTTYVPVFWNLDPILLSGSDLLLALVLNAAVVLLVLFPLYKPRPRRLLDTVFLAQKRVIVAGFALASLGYYNYTYRLPRATLTMTIGFLAIAIPVWFIWIRQRPPHEVDRALLIGDDPDQLIELLESTKLPYVGYLSPTPVSESVEPRTAIADGGIACPHLGGLSRIDDVLVEHEIDTAVLAFREPDRGEFFGALDACYEHGVNAKVHRRFADSVLVAGDDDGGLLIDVEIEPWDLQDYTIKRAFDVAFATTGLVLAAPLAFVIAAAIKLDDGGSFMYRQERTAGFGEPFPVYKFRTMIEDAEDDTGATISPEDAGDDDPRVTRVGHIIRRTHLDEIPQLWSILVGHMSVVGPRPERPELEVGIKDAGIDWEKRWFVKPGLTGLAQINDVTGHNPDEKLRYDLAYIRRRSLWFDIKIVIRQLWKIFGDLVATVSEVDEPD